MRRRENLFALVPKTAASIVHLPHSLQLLPFHVEHIIARQHGGSEDPENLAWSCDRCNAYKGPNLSSIDPETVEVVTLFHPRRDVWGDHFVMSEDQVEGRTPTGRATVRLLQMNARRRIEIRRELLEEGDFN
jgi:hypothetical protein